MANRGFLINTSAPTSDPRELERLREQDEHVDGEIASSANRLPIPWLLCFRTSDLRPVPCDFMPLELPFTTVEQAVNNLEQSLPVFEAIANNPALARPYWNLSCTLLRRLPLPYLTMDPIEVLQLRSEPPATLAAHIVGALSGGLDAIPHIKILTDYDDNVPPYPLEVLYTVPSGGQDQGRQWNASVLDGGFQPSFKYVTWNKGERSAAPASPGPVPSSVFGELYDTPGLLGSWIKSEVPSSPGAELTLLPGEQERLQVNIYACSTADAKRLEGSTQLRRRLDDLARDRLAPWCQKYGFGWNGFDFSAPEWARD